MSARILAGAPARERVAAELPALLAGLPSPLAPVAERVLGLDDAEIDLVARDAGGAAVVVRVADSGETLAALAELAAQRAWLAPRLREWVRLAPGLGLAPAQGVRALLVAPAFDARTRAAAQALAGVELARVVALAFDGREALALELLGMPGPARPPEPAGAGGPQPGAPPEPPPGPGFRSGLRDDELGLPRRSTRLAPRGPRPE